jgi:hypothetical protein
MLSVTPKAPSSARQAAKTSKPLGSSDKHYQTVYDDGRSRYIVERRRHAKVVHGGDATDILRSSHLPVLSGNAETLPERLSPCGSRSYPSTKVSSGKDGLAPRDCHTKKSSSTVVVTSAALKPNGTKINEGNSSPQKWIELTPPPTPRLRRLSSPELSDLEDAPFCECDGAALVKYCTACKKEADPCSKWF